MTTESLFLELEIPVHADVPESLKHLVSAVSASVEGIVDSNNKSIASIEGQVADLNDRIRKIREANECLLALKQRMTT